MFQQNHIATTSTTSKEHKTIIKEDEIIQFLQLIHDKKNMSNFLKLFNDIVFYNHDEFNQTTKKTKSSTTIITDTDNDIVFSYKQYSFFNNTNVDKQCYNEVYKLYLYQRTISMEFHKYGTNRIEDNIVFKFKYTNLKNFYKCKHIFIEILKLYDHLYSDSTIDILNTENKPITIEDKLNRGDIIQSIRCVDYFLNSLEEIFKHYKDTTFDIYDNTIMNISIFLSNNNTNTSTTTSIDTIKDTIRVNYSFYLCCEFLKFNSFHVCREYLHSSDDFIKMYLSIPINDYRNMCGTLRKYNTYQRFTSRYLDTRILPCDDSNYNIDCDYFFKDYLQFTKGFESIICEDESTNKFKVVKPIQ